MIANLRASAEAHGFHADAFGEYEGFLRTLLTVERPTFADVEKYPELAGMVLPKGEARPTQGMVLVTLARPWQTVQDRNGAIDAVRAALDGLPHDASETATLTGIAVISYDTQRAIAASLAGILGFAGLGVLAWLMLFFRNLGCVALALLPAAAGLVVLLAVMSAGGLSLNAINLIALPLVLGIGVDDGIFLTAIYRKASRGHLDGRGFVEQLAASGHAVTMTSLTTVLAFGSLAFTSVPAIRALGVFTAVGVGAAWAAALVALLPLLVMLYGRAGERSE